MPSLVPILVKVFTKLDGSYDYPNFRGTLQIFKDKPGYASGSIHFDKTSEATEDGGAESPVGTRLCMKLVDSEFAQQALAAFPQRVTTMTETEAESFWNNKAFAHIPSEKIDKDLIQTYKNLMVLYKELNNTAEIAKLKAKLTKALNPDDEEPGVIKDKRKVFSDMKAREGITIITS